MADINYYGHWGIFFLPIPSYLVLFKPLFKMIYLKDIYKCVLIVTDGKYVTIYLTILVHFSVKDINYKCAC